MLNEWKLEIQESERLVAKGILCMIRTDGSKLYVRVKNHEGDFIELVPLTKAELKEAEIQETELVINDRWDVEVQESEFTNEEVERKFQEEKRKKNIIPLNNEADALKMKEIAEKAQEILARKDASPEDLKAENEDLRLKLEIIAEKELERRLDVLGIKDEETRAKFKSNPSALQGYEIRVKEQMSSNSGQPSGSAPLNDFQTGRNIQGFANVEEMVKDLRKRAKSFVPYEAEQAQKILDKLFEKTVQGMKQRNSVVLPFENLKVEPELEGKNVKELTVPINAIPEAESELKKFGIGKTHAEKIKDGEEQ